MRWMILALCLGGCAPAPIYYKPVVQIPGPDGRSAFRILCPDGRTMCFRYAGKMCPDGYSIIESGQVMVGATTTHHRGVSRTTFDGVGRMFIQCKGVEENLEEPRNCRSSSWCKQLGRCRSEGGRCVR